MIPYQDQSQVPSQDVLQSAAQLAINATAAPAPGPIDAMQVANTMYTMKTVTASLQLQTPGPDRELQGILQALGSSNPTDVERAALSLARIASNDETRAHLLSHPSANGAVVRLAAGTEATDRFAAAACLSAVRHLASDPLGRRRLLDPQQFLGPRPPESVVESMFVGLIAALRSPDSHMVANSASSLNCLLLSEVTFVRIVALPEGRFKELCTGLVEVMDYNLEDETVMSDAANALAALIAKESTRKMLLAETAGLLEHVLAGLTQILFPTPDKVRLSKKRCADKATAAAQVLAVLSSDTDGQLKIMTRHQNLAALMEGL
eukprot:gene21475-25832_t